MSLQAPPQAASPSPSPPLTRGSSPSPSISPTPALLARHSYDRACSSTSTGSTGSTVSGHSTTSRSSTGSAIARRRGYVRPQGVQFADSARNRDSVLSLGSIAHLQYYFARTGVLDGKGGQLARTRKDGSYNLKVSITDVEEGSRMPIMSPVGGDMVSSPTEEEDEGDESEDWGDESMMLPPTVSTYSHRTQFIAPPPDAETLRNEVKDCLAQVTKAVAEVRSHISESLDRRKEELSSASDMPLEGAECNEASGRQSPTRAWHEIQGMHMLDVVTLAIKAAKDYYTMHEHPQRLSKIKSERQIREELLGVMDVLKRMATRNFAGGIREDEAHVIEAWVLSVQALLEEEQKMEEQETRNRQSWPWLEGTWAVDERSREWEFLQSFSPDVALPAWTAADQAAELPTPFLATLRSGLLLVGLHNRILKKSRRQFGEIKTFHTDTAKPYRAADNLRFWIKAAEIRWEVRLRLDVMAVVYARGEHVWSDFDAAIFQWARAVREEITREWKRGSVQI